MSELHAQPRSRGRSLFWPAYMLSWAVLAGGALAYLSLNALPPSQQQETLATLPQSSPESNRAELDREQLTAQVKSLNETVAKLRGDLARIKSEQQNQMAAAPVATDRGLTAMRQPDSTMTETSDITTSSVAKPEASPTANATEAATPLQQEATLPPAQPEAAEQTPAGTAPILPKIVNAPASPTPPATAPTTTEPTQVAAAPAAAREPPRRLRNLATSPLRAGRVPPLPGINAARANSATGSSRQSSLSNSPTRDISTASLPVVNNVAPRTPAATPAAAPALGPSTFGVSTVTQRPLPSAAALSLSTAQSVTGLRASWLLLTSRHPETFNRLQPRYVADQANRTYRLLAGPILSHAEADRICTQLRAQSVSCGVTAYVGSALQ